MLLGCCHCGDVDPPSVPSESNPPSVSVNSESIAFDDPNCANYCDVKSDQITITVLQNGTAGPPWADRPTWMSSALPSEVWLYNPKGPSGTIYTQPCNPCQSWGGFTEPWTLRNGSPHCSGSGASSVFASPIYGRFWAKVAVTYTGLTPALDHCDVECFGFAAPSISWIADGSGAYLNPTLIYCGGDPNNHGAECDFWCIEASLWPNRTDATLRYRDQQTALAVGPCTLRRVYNDGSYLIGTGYAAIKNTWDTNPNSRDWRSADAMILGSGGPSSSAFLDLIDHAAAGGLTYPDHNVSIGLSSYSCVYMDWFEDATHLNVITLSFSTVNNNSGFYIISIPLDRFSADVLQIWRDAMTNLGRPPSDLAQCYNASNWQWFNGVRGTVNARGIPTTGTNTAEPYYSTFWTRPNFENKSHVYFRWNPAFMTCEDIAAREFWSGSERLAAYQEYGTGGGTKITLPASFVFPEGFHCDSCFGGESASPDRYNALYSDQTGAVSTVVSRYINISEGPKGTGRTVTWSRGQMRAFADVYWPNV